MKSVATGNGEGSIPLSSANLGTKMEKERVLSILRDYEFYSTENHGDRGSLPVHFHDKYNVGISLDWDKETFTVYFNTDSWGTWKHQELHFNHLGTWEFNKTLNRAGYLIHACNNKIKRLEE